MENLAFLVKSYNKHLPWTKQLIDTINTHNKDNIKVYLSVPSQDVSLFKNNIDTQNCEIITDEEVVKDNISQNWFTQQLVKMKFSETGLCKNYFWIDGDSYFIRDFLKTSPFFSIVKRNMHRFNQIHLYICI